MTSAFTTERDETLRLAAEAATLARSRGEPETGAEIERAAGRLREGRLTVAVVGEFKRGKSTLLNAILEERLFPEADPVATSMVSTAAYGEQERIVVHVRDPDDDAKTIARPITRAEIEDYVTEAGNPGNVRRARLLTIEVPNERLADGLVLVDTPGVGGLNTEHTAVTYGFVTSADVVLFVLDAFTTLSTEELAFLKIVGEHCHDVIFVVTKIDKVADSATVVENTREKAAETLSRELDDIVVVPVSSHAKLEYLKSGDEDDLEASNFEELEDRVWTTLRERGAAIMLVRTLGVVARSLDALIAPITTELETYKARSAEEIDAAERSLAAATARATGLRASEAGWRKTLQREQRDITLALEKQFKAGARRLRRGAEKLLDDERLLTAPERITPLLERDSTLLATELADTLEKRGLGLCDRLARETELELNAAVPEAELAVDAAAPSLSDIRGQDPGRSIFRGATGLSMGSSSGGLIGGIIGTIVAGSGAGAAGGSIVPGPGTIIGAGIGAMIGAAIGIRSNLKDIRESDRRRRRDAVAKQVGPWLEEWIGQIESQLREALVASEQAIVDAFEDVLRAEHERLEHQRAAIVAARRRTKEEAATRIAALREPLASLQRARNDAEAQAQAVVARAQPRERAGAVADTGAWAED